MNSLRKKISITRILIALGLCFTGFYILYAVGVHFSDLRDERSKRDHISHEIKSHKVGEHELYVPIAYDRLTGNNITTEGAYLTAYYPGGAPVIQNPRVLKRQDKWYRHIGISAEDLGRYKNHTPEKALQAMVAFNQATKVAGEQYGLTYQTQPDHIQNDRRELWIESPTEPNVSFIMCTKKDSPRSTPQCSHEFYDSKFKYSLRYDKRLMPEWRAIRENVLKLMESFESKETAHDFISEQYLSTYPEQMGEQP